MRVLFVAPWDQMLGGVGQVVGNLARYLHSRGHQVFFFHPGECNVVKERRTQWGFPGLQLNIRKVFFRTRPVRTFLTFVVFFLPTMYQLTRLIRRHGIQIIHIHYPLDSFIYFGICRWILPIKLITSVHGADLFPGGRPKARYSFSMRFLFMSSDRILAPSRAFLGEVMTIFPSVQDKSTYVHNAVDLDEFCEPPHSTTGRRHARYILSIAAHNEKKGLDVLLHSFARLAGSNPELRLVLVGDGPLRKSLEELAKELCLNGRSEFVGRKDRDQTVALLHDCEVFVLPSRSEPFGIAVIEAMACRRPVVASAVGGIREIIEDGKGGILVQPGDPEVLAEAIRRVVADRTLQASLGQHGYETVRERFTWLKAGAVYESIFEELVDSQRERRVRISL